MAICDINGTVISNDSSGGNTLLWNLQKWSGKVLVTDGNSLVGSTNWGTRLAEYLGMTHVNNGVYGGELAGGTMSDIMENIATNYPDTCDLVILQGDSNVGDTDGDVTQQMDGENPQTTWTARINYLVRCIKAKYPNVVIVLMPDSVRYDSSDGKRYYQHPASPNILYHLNRNSYIMMKAIAEYNRHHFWAFDGDTPFNPTNSGNEYVIKTASSNFTENDGTHPGGYFAEAKGKALAWWCAGLTYHPDADNHYVEGWENTVTASITNTLTNVTNSKSAVNWQYYMPYTATLTADDGYTLDAVTITMGGVDITADVDSVSNKAVYENGVINIRRVTGDVVVIAAATAAA